MKNIENFKKENDSYYIEQSYIKDSFVHIPVHMERIEGIPDVDIDLPFNLSEKVEEKYPEVFFTGEWKTLQDDKGNTKEYLLGIKEK